MKIWITRQTAFGIQCGGLERLFVWFRKPRWVSEWRPYEKDDIPFGDLSDLNGRLISQWEAPSSGNNWITHSLSFGKMFGYNDSDNEDENIIASYVWKELENHFKNKPFKEWHQMEKDDEVKREDFLLEIDLDIKLKNE